MPPALIIHAEALNPRFRFYPLWLEPMLGHLTNAALLIYHLTLFLGNLVVIVITLGTPYLYHRIYRYDEDNEIDSSRKYSQMVQALDMLWQQCFDFLLHILPVLFPMVSSLGLPPCSITSFASTITFIVGAASIATRIIFKVRVKVLQNEHAINEWLRASNASWLKVPNKSFWTLFSLPTVIFFLSISLLISTIVLTSWERSVAGTTTSSEIPGCSIKRLQTFKYTLMTTLVITATHFAFIFIKLNSLTASYTAESITSP